MKKPCFIWLKDEAPWSPPRVVPQLCDGDVLDYQLANPNANARPQVLQRHNLTPQDSTLPLSVLVVQFPFQGAIE